MGREPWGQDVEWGGESLGHGGKLSWTFNRTNGEKLSKLLLTFPLVNLACACVILSRTLLTWGVLAVHKAKWIFQDCGKGSALVVDIKAWNRQGRSTKLPEGAQKEWLKRFPKEFGRQNGWVGAKKAKSVHKSNGGSGKNYVQRVGKSARKHLVLSLTEQDSIGVW